MFKGGLNYNTTEEGLKEHFSQYGNIIDVVIMKFPDTKRQEYNKIRLRHTWAREGGSGYKT